MNTFSTLYKTPAGNVGIHHGIFSDCIESAKIVSTQMLSAGTPWRPEEFTIIEVFEETQG